MKNYISLIVCMLLCITGVAQEAQTIEVSNQNHNLPVVKESTPTPSRIIRSGNKKLRGLIPRWYDIVDAVDKSYGSTGVIYGNDHYNQIWSDSTMLAPFNGSSGTTYSGVWIKSVAAFFDPVDPRYNDPVQYPGEEYITNLNPFIVDSLFIPCIYTRNQSKPNIIDTLIVSVIQGNGVGSNNDLANRYYGPAATTSVNHSTDTLRFLHGFLDLNPASPNQHTFMASSPASVVNIKIPLTAASENDTTVNGFNYVQIPINLNVPAGNKVAASIVFKSGDTWTPNADTIYLSGSFSTPNFNNFRFVAFEEFNGGFQQYDKGVWSQASLMRNDTSGWGNWHIPCYAFDNTSYEHQWFQWLVTCPTCGPDAVNDLFSNVSKLSVYPNPVEDRFTLKFDVMNAIHDATIDLIDISGVMISSKKIGTRHANTSVQEDIQTYGLASGVYFVKLNTTEGQRIEKILIH